MTFHRFAGVLGLIVPLVVVGQQRNDAKFRENEARKSAEYVKDHPPRESTGLVPLADLGRGIYRGEQGGLYPAGANTPPPAHLKAGLRLATEIVPLDGEGSQSPAGRIVFLTIGMSNTHRESIAFVALGAADKQIGPRVKLVDGAHTGQDAGLMANPNPRYWAYVNDCLSQAGVTAKQVQAIWLKQAERFPKDVYPGEMNRLGADIVTILHHLHDSFPNLKIAYLSSRIYGGYANVALNPEPHAYEGGLAVKRVIVDQIAGKPELNYDPAKGPALAPWIAWGPYLWADGLKGRKDGLVWKREDLDTDGTHPSASGCQKVAHMLLGFLKNDPTSSPWFVKQ